MFRSKDIELPDAEAAPLMHEPSTVCDSSGGSGQRRHLFAWSCGSLVGPGMIVSLADTDAACLIVAADSGARWGYSLLLLQLLLIPVLFMAQELTIRLGVHTRKGHTACIKARFGAFWAHVTCAALVMSCIGATVSEMSGIASVGELWGLSRVASTSVAAVLLVSVVVCGKYRQVEAIGIALGLFECAFILTMLMARPSLAELARGLATVHAEPSYYKLVAANIGAVIMPWMIYFQQSAIVAKGLSTPQHEARERTDTLCGALLTQLIMISTLITMAATRHVTHTVTLTNVLPLRSLHPSTAAAAHQHTRPSRIICCASGPRAPRRNTHTHTRARAGRRDGRRDGRLVRPDRRPRAALARARGRLALRRLRRGARRGVGRVRGAKRLPRRLARPAGAPRGSRSIEPSAGQAGRRACPAPCPLLHRATRSGRLALRPVCCSVHASPLFPLSRCRCARCRFSTAATRPSCCSARSSSSAAPTSCSSTSS